MTTINNDDAIANAGLGDGGLPPAPAAKGSIDISRNDKETVVGHDVQSTTDSDEDWPDKPTEEELRTLRRVSGKIKWSMWTIAFVELCERFSYYGSSVLYTNFVNKSLPDGSTTGAPLESGGQAGALGMGPKAAQGISLFNQFFAYLMPLVG
jgi:proton-dependent oligopeptide transporter, POT family